jgi:hypothetical protein
MSDSEPNGNGQAPSTFLARRKAAFFKPPNRPRPVVPVRPGEEDLSDDERRQRITRIDRTERKWGLAAAGLAGAIALISTVPYVDNPKTPIKEAAKNGKCTTSGFNYSKALKDCIIRYDRAHWVFEMGVLLVFALALFIAVRVGRRSLLGFTALMNGLAFESTAGAILGIPFIFFGGWLLIRAWRVQRYGSPTATKATAGGAPAARPTRPPPRERKPKANQVQAARTPEPSKRYTPKAPKRKRPPPPE